ncbi:MAG: cytochrome c3 family protein, partial [Planctomycetota bacterium]
MTGWDRAVHRTSTAVWNGEGANPFHLSNGALSVADNACEGCHRPHGAEHAEWLLKGPGEEALCLTCHNGSTASKDVSGEFENPYGHLVGRYADLHDAYENVDPLGRALDGGENNNSRRHVECADCHNSHATASGLHRPGTSAVSDVLRRVSGVRLTYGAGRWTEPSFRWVPAVPGASYEYEICMKCHSAWIWESLPPATTDGTPQTDPSVEFNPNNASYHGVVGTPRASVYGDYVPPWSSTSRMYCTDCHGDDSSSASGGAHGSRVRFLLRGSYDRTTGNPGTNGHLCFRCHRYSTYADAGSIAAWRSTGFSSLDRRNLHALHADKPRSDTGRPSVCRDCHSARPHGAAENRALLVTAADEAPYRDAEAGIVTIDVMPASQAWDNAIGGNCS